MRDTIKDAENILEDLKRTHKELNEILSEVIIDIETFLILKKNGTPNNDDIKKLIREKIDIGKRLSANSVFFNAQFNHIESLKSKELDEKKPLNIFQRLFKKKDCS